MSRNYNIAILPGDGIGPEVMQQALKVLSAVCKRFNIKVNIKKYNIGGIAIDKNQTALPISTIQGCEQSDAILLGSVGGPKWENLKPNKQPERAALLPLRKHFNLFCNLRPASLYKELKNFCPLRNNISNKGFDILCVRELTGGMYFGKKGRKKIKNLEYAFDIEKYSNFEIERILKISFDLARNRKKKLVSIDKANVLETSVMWREIACKMSKNYPDVLLQHMYIDNAVMQLIKKPSQFDVIVCSNIFGDIVSDVCAAISGSIGILPSASLNNSGFGIYEPIGGSAPEIAKKNIANPIAQILSLALLFRYSLKNNKVAECIENAVKCILKKNMYTIDLYNDMYPGKRIGTKEMGSLIAKIIVEE